LTFSEDFATLSDREMVIEAVAEDENLKIDVFQMLDACEGPQAILATNTPRSRLSSSPWRPSAEQVIGMHFSIGTGAAPRGGHLFAPHERRDHRSRPRLRSESLNKRVISSKDRPGSS